MRKTCTLFCALLMSAGSLQSLEAQVHDATPSGIGLLRALPILGMMFTQEEDPAKDVRAVEVQKLAATLHALRASEAQRVAALEQLTREALAAKDAATAAQQIALALMKPAEERMALQALQQAQEAESKAAEAVATDETRTAEMALAEGQYRLALKSFVDAQGQEKAAGMWLRTLQDERANGALQDYVVQTLSGGTSGQGEQAEPSEFWIGVQCEPAIEVVVRSVQLGGNLVTVKGGLKVNSVTPDTPAQAAGILELDVILFMNDKPTNAIEELVAVISETGEKQATLSVVRGQDPMTLTITPAKRPDETTASSSNDTPAHALLWNYHLAGRGYGDLQGTSFATMPELPQGFEAHVQFAPGNAATFVLKQQGTEWRVADDTMVEVPEAARPFAEHVWRFVGPVSSQPMAVSRTWIPLQGRLFENPHQPAESTDTNTKLDELKRQIDELRELIEKLKKE